jgi:hypothetical protein
VTSKNEGPTYQRNAADPFVLATAALDQSRSGMNSQAAPG